MSFWNSNDSRDKGAPGCSFCGRSKSEVAQLVGEQATSVTSLESGGELLVWEWRQLWPEFGPDRVRLDVEVDENGLVSAYKLPDGNWIAPVSRVVALGEEKEVVFGEGE